MKIYIEENGVVRELDSSEPIVGIGRGKDNRIAIDDPRSSRHHCRILDTPNGFYVEDLKSRNGTFLNGARVSRQAFREGDTIEVGSTRFHFQRAPGQAPPARRTEPEGLDSPSSSEHQKETQRPVESPELVSSKSEAATVIAAVDVYLEGLEGDYAGTRVPITKLPYTIGRHAHNDFRIDDARASGAHARIVRRGEAFWIEDLDSRNGTFVNGKQIKESPLLPGSRIRIGSLHFRIHTPAVDENLSAEAVFADSAVGADVVGEDEFANFDVREFLSDSEGGRQQPLLVVGILLAMSAILYLTVDITLKRIQKQRLDPMPPTNRIVANWSFESEVSEDGAVVGWTPVGEGLAKLQVTTDGQGVQWPGEAALEVVPTTTEIALVQAGSQAIGADPGGSYFLSGHVVNRDAVAAGLVVSWWREGAEGPIEVGRSFTTAVRLGEAEELDVGVDAPTSATEARVGCFVLKSDSVSEGAVFDRIYFGTIRAPWLEDTSVAASDLVPQEVPAETEDGESGEEAEPDQASTTVRAPRTLAAPVALKAKQAQGTLFAEVERNGVISGLRRGATPVVLRLYPGFPLSQDPFAIGPSMSLPVVFGRIGGLKMMTEVPNLKLADWFPVEMRVRELGSEIQCRFRFHKGRSGPNLPESVAVFLELPKSDVGISAFESGGGVVEVAETASDFSLAELVLGVGADRVVLRFNPPASIRYAPADQHRPLRGAIVVAAKPTGKKTLDLEVTISMQARQEELAVRQILDNAKSFRSERKLANALALLRDLRTTYPWRDFSVVSDLEAEIRNEAAVVVKELALEVKLLERLPSPFLRRFITERGEALKEQFGVSGDSRQTIEGLLNRIEAIWKSDGGQARQARRLVEQADALFRDGRINLADVYVKEAKLLDVGDKSLDRRIRDLTNLIEINRKGKASGVNR